MRIDESEKARRMDLLRFQAEELESAQLRVGEREELSELRTMYTNSEKIASGLTTALLSLDGDEEMCIRDRSGRGRVDFGITSRFPSSRRQNRLGCWPPILYTQDAYGPQRPDRNYP